MRRGWTWAINGYLAAVLGFLYLPIAVMMVMAFNRWSLYELPVRFDTVWFEALARNDRLLRASLNSVLLALANTVVATVLGTMAALAFARYRFRGRTLLQLLLFPPITIPWLIIGTSMLVLFFWIGIGRGLHAMLLGHVALSLPYVIVVVGARLKSFGPALEEAAATLGASPWQTFWRVSAPGGGGVSTLAVEIYSAIRKGFTPEINAVSTIIILVSMGIMLLVGRFYRFGG